MSNTLMKHSLPIGLPIDDLLTLGPKDNQLIEGIDSVELEPSDLEMLCTVLHCGIRDNTYIGTHLMDYFRKTVEGGTEQAPVFMLYRHILDIGDSIATLLRFGSASMASILLRALFESDLAINFILEGNQLNKNRSLAYWAFYQINRLNDFTTYDPSTDSGKRFHDLLDSHPIFSKTEFRKKDYSKERKELEQILSQDKFLPFWQRYKELNKP